VAQRNFQSTQSYNYCIAFTALRWFYWLRRNDTP